LLKLSQIAKQLKTYIPSFHSVKKNFQCPILQEWVIYRL